MDRQQAPLRPQPTISEQPPQPTATVTATLLEHQPLLPITLAIPPQPIVTAMEKRLAQQSLTPTTLATPIRLILIRMAVQQELLQPPLTILALPQQLIETCMVRHRELPHPQLIILATGIPSNVVTTLILPSGRGRTGHKFLKSKKTTYGAIAFLQRHHNSIHRLLKLYI